MKRQASVPGAAAFSPTPARRWLDSATAVNPGFYQAYAERAGLRLATGDTAGARTDAQTAVRLRPGSEPLAAEDVLIALDLRQGHTAAVRARVAPTHLRFHLKEPRFDAIRGEPRFQRLMERLRVRETTD